VNEPRKTHGARRTPERLLVELHALLEDLRALEQAHAQAVAAVALLAARHAALSHSVAALAAAAVTDHRCGAG
jgi:hypothetical protein